MNTAAAPGGRSLSARGSRWLLDRGLITPAALHRHGLIAHDTSQSNAVSIIEIGDGTGFAIKDTHTVADIAQGSPAQELALYRTLRDGADAGLPAIAPALVDHDEGERFLVLQALVRHRRMDDIGARRELFDPDVAAAVGEALGHWHRAAGNVAGRFPDVTPWMLHVDEEDGRLDVLDQPPFADVLATVLADPVLSTIAPRCRAVWEADTVIHGDVRFANILLTAPPIDVRLVDWETSGRGDHRWDIAGVLQEYLSRDASADGRPASDRDRIAADACRAGHARAWGAADAWADLAPFVAARVVMRAFQVAGWSRSNGAGTEEVDRHLDVARRLLETEERG